jgi:hypothetical protein
MTFPARGSDRPEVLIGFAGRRWTVPPGGELTFGRGTDRDIRFGYEPLDEHVSRLAGTLAADTAHVVVRNESASRPLLLQVPGSEREIEPGEAVTLPRSRDFAVIVVGGYGTRYELSVLTGRVGEPERPPERDEPGSPPTVAAGPASLTGAQRRLLVALCEPLLRPSGRDAAPATYRQIGERLGRQPGYVRNVLKELRESLAGAGVPGLLPDDDRDAAYDFRRPLAAWAIRTGAVGAADLLLGDESTAGG